MMFVYVCNSDNMDRSDLIKLLVTFIAVIFVLSMFSQFGKGGTLGTGGTINGTTTVIGRGFAMCKIAALSTEITITPWTNETAAIADSLKAQNKIDYTNVIGNRGVLILPNGANISDVRAAFADIGSSITADASCSVVGIVNFTLQNGSIQPQAPGSIEMSLDPFSRVGDKLNLDITADIGDAGITNMKVTTIPDTTEITVNASAECSDVYHIEGLINWENRELNTSAMISGLNISTNNINYTKNDIVTFSRPLNSSELDIIKAKNASYVYNLLPQGLQTNTTDKSMISSLLSGYDNVTPTFQPSPITIDVDSASAMTDAVGLISSSGGTVTSQQRGCTLTIAKMMDVNGEEMLVSPSVRQMNYFMDIADVPGGNGNLNISGTASYVGRVITKFDLISTK